MPAPRFGYTASFDGVRAVAIGFVLAFHADESLVRGGWVGVDLFFVLSGFLISTILIQEFRTTGTVDLKRFYARRFLRLSPALVVLLVVLLALSFFVTEKASHDIRSSLWPAAMYITNWAIAFEWVRGTVLPHTWSLAIEEQFYLVWPPVLVVLLRRRVAPARLIAIVAAAVVCAVVVRVALYDAGANMHRLKFGSDVRADTVLMGCGLAIAYTSGWLTPFRRVLLPASYAACVPLLLVVATVRSTDRLVFLGGYTAIALCCAVLTAGLLVEPDSRLSHLLDPTARLDGTAVLQPVPVALADLLRRVQAVAE